MMPSPEHLIIAPILIPLFAGALMLLYDESQRRAKLIISLISAALLLGVSIEMLDLAESGAVGEVSYYLLGNWETPFGIVLVLDRLSALMLLLVSLLAIPALIYSAAGWHRQGQHFHSLFQFLLMGLTGAFLTGDLFNLFVFFEVLLAASYGLLLHGSGQLRVRSGLHYIAINLAASLLFLIGVSLIYGVTGTLNMADLATRIPELTDEQRPFMHGAAAVLGVAFLVKAGMWPVSFWLPMAYMAGAAPVAAMFAVMTKVGVYIVLRLSMLLFGADAGASAGLGAQILMYGGMATLTFGFVGVLASQGLGRMAGHLVLVSSGTVLAVTGFAVTGGGEGMLAGGLYYMVSSTLATSALFLLIEPMSREQGGIASMLALTADAYGLDEFEDDAGAEVGLAIPATLSVLGLSFAVCALLLAGLPPLSGFVGKFAMLSGAVNQNGTGLGPVDSHVWWFMALVILSGLATLVALVRVGIQTFWGGDDNVPKVLALEIAPVVALLAIATLMTIRAEPAMRYAELTAQGLYQPQTYIAGVMGARPFDPSPEPDAEPAPVQPTEEPPQ